MTRLSAGLAAGVVFLAAGATASAALWGEAGHTLVASAALTRLDADMPAFFRDAAPQLRYLNPEPDRWRDRDATEMDEAFKYDHYIDLENVPAAALDAADRFEFIQALYDAGLEEPEQDAGFLPFRIVELYERLTSGFARWRTAAPQERQWIEERIINDAGILGHYIADAANPHHTTIHYNGWSRDAANPRDFTTENDFHWRFESQFVEAHVALKDVIDALPAEPRELDDVRAAAIDFIREANTCVERLYELEQEYGFRPDDVDPEEKAFVVDRLAAGADMLRAVWHAAWIDSEAIAQRR